MKQLLKLKSYYKYIFIFFIFINLFTIDCPICLEPINEEQKIVLPCSDTFHKECLEEQFNMLDKRSEEEQVIVLFQDYDEEFKVEPESQTVTLKHSFINCKDCPVCGIYIGDFDILDLYHQFYLAYKNKSFFECINLAKILSQKKFCESARHIQYLIWNKLLDTTLLKEDKRIEYILNKQISLDKSQQYIANYITKLKKLRLQCINNHLKTIQEIKNAREKFLNWFNQELKDTVFNNL